MWVLLYDMILYHISLKNNFSSLLPNSELNLKEKSNSKRRIVKQINAFEKLIDQDIFQVRNVCVIKNK